MRRQLCLDCSLAGAGLYLLLLLAEIQFPFQFYKSFMSQKNVVFVTKIISLPLVSGIRLFCSASLYMQMLTLGRRRSDRSFLSLAIFMMKFEFSSQSLELINHLEQSVCLNKHRGGCSFPLPNQLQIFSTHSFLSYFWTKHPHLLFPLQSQCKPHFCKYQVPYSQNFFKNFSVCYSSKKLFLPKGEIIR